MRMLFHILAVTACALVLHLSLGWAWTLGAGALGGAFAPSRGWLVGTLGVTIGWTVLVGYNFMVAPAATQSMTDTMGGIIGNTPGIAIVAGTILLGTLLGGLGAAAGVFARQATHPAQ